MNSECKKDTLLKIAGIIGPSDSKKGYASATSQPLASGSSKKSLSKPVPAAGAVAPLQEFNKSEFTDAYDFWRDIAPYIKENEIGLSGLPFKVMKVFERIPSVNVSYKKLKGKNLGQTVKDRNTVIGHRVELSNVPGRATPKDLVHEMRHIYERLMERLGKGFSDKSKGVLDKVYGFSKADIKPDTPGYSAKWGPEEMFTTNKQHQFRAYMDLKNRIKRRPSYKEYFDYIKGLSPEELIKMRKRLANGYQQEADKVMTDDEIKANIELYRKALMEISMQGRRQKSDMSGWNRFVRV